MSLIADFLLWFGFWIVWLKVVVGRWKKEFRCWEGEKSYVRDWVIFVSIFIWTRNRGSETCFFLRWWWYISHLWIRYFGAFSAPIHFCVGIRMTSARERAVPLVYHCHQREIRHGVWAQEILMSLVHAAMWLRIIPALAPNKICTLPLYLRNNFMLWATIRPVLIGSLLWYRVTFWRTLPNFSQCSCDIHWFNYSCSYYLANSS